MKVLLINGSPNAHGCTDRALGEVAAALAEEGVSSRVFHIGRGPVRGCVGCGGCARSGTHRCVYDDDPVNEALALVESFDGFVFGSPVHYASAGGGITSFMDRMFYAGSALLRGKPAAAVVSARRAGTTAALDQLMRYFIIAGMPVVPSTYWPMVHGSAPQDVERDEEGLQVMRNLGRNMAYMLKAFALARESGLLPPEPETPRRRTNFIR